VHKLRLRLADESLLLLIFALYACMRILALPAQVGQDTWLTLLGGREVVENGPPSVDTYTVIAGGVEWVDQQWLGQATFYAAEQAGTLKAAMGLHALLVLGAFALALAAGRTLGGTSRNVARIALLAVVSIVLTTWYMRTQSLVYPLFVGVLWLLICDARSPSRRVLFVLPLLAVWANVHGSVVLGAGLVGVLALTSIVRVRPMGLRLGNLPRSALLAAGALICLFVSPYAPDLPGYYGDTIANPDFGKFVTEWAPSTPRALTAPFYALAFAAVWILARHARRVTSFEILALAVLLIGAMLAIRSITWFAFAAVMVLPGALGSADEQAADEAPEALRLGVAMVACAGIVAASVAFLARAPDAFEEEAYPAALASSIARAAEDPSARVYASVRYADWLLWKYPTLAGRVAYDARFELLPGTQLSRIYRFLSQVGQDWERHAEGNEIIVLPRDRGIDIPHTLPTYRVLLAQGGLRLRYRDDDTVVLVRTQAAR
jgi:hypothetical protein